MPFKSKAQRGAMFAAAAGEGKVGIDKKAAAKFIAHARMARKKKGVKK